MPPAGGIFFGARTKLESLVAHDRDNIFLVGMMGAGKSAVGRLLAARLDRIFVDTDHEIEAKTGVSIPVIFDVEGETGFRKREEQMIDEVSQRSGLVVATGGGAVLSTSTKTRMRERGFTIYLHAKVADLWHRMDASNPDHPDKSRMIAGRASAGLHRSSAPDQLGEKSRILGHVLKAEH